MVLVILCVLRSRTSLTLYSLSVGIAVDLTSLLGRGGRGSRRIAERLLETGLADVACTDIHGVGELPDVEKAVARLRKLCGDAGLESLLHTGPLRLALESRPASEAAR